VTPEEIPRGLLGLRKAWRFLEAGLEASSSTFLLKVEVTPELGRKRMCGLAPLWTFTTKVARSASLGPRKVLRDDWDGITRAAMRASGRDGLPTHTTN
jgi:hypothetical protein